jgi:hypothetical protein
VGGSVHHLKVVLAFDKRLVCPLVRNVSPS